MHIRQMTCSLTYFYFHLVYFSILIHSYGAPDLFKDPIGYKWKTVESNKRRVVHQVDRIDNFQELGAPMLRFRSTIRGPHAPEKFADFIMNLDERSRWDPAIAEVDERYPVYDLDAANIAMGVGRYGDCTKLGVGYCRTKQSVVSPREQLTLCGIQDFECGSTLIWGTEMEEWHNHLLPGDKRHTRAKSHLFSVALTPSSPETFDVEYILQLEIGGAIPKWMAAPILSESVKNMFNHAKDVYGGKDGEIDAFIKETEAQRAKEVVLETAAVAAVEDVLMQEAAQEAADNVPDAIKEEVVAMQTEIVEAMASDIPRQLVRLS